MIASFLSVPALLRGTVQSAPASRRVGWLLCSALVPAVIGAVVVSLGAAPSAQAGGTCVPDAGYTALSPLTLADAHEGLTVTDDGIVTYGIGGTSVPMIRGALNSCAPSFTGANTSGEFLAYTSYAVNWSYDAVHADTTTCRLTDVKVGLRLRQLLPRLITESTAPTDVTRKWAGFIGGLRAHEDGHKAIDAAQAQALLDDLRNLRAPCADMTARADALTLTHLTRFVSANADHDKDTDHGRDQGAVW